MLRLRSRHCGPSTSPLLRQGCSGKIRGLSSESLPAKVPVSDVYLPSPPAGRGGEGRVRGADEPVRRTAHLTLPLRGPLPLPPEGRRGALASRIIEMRVERTISSQSFSFPGTALRKRGEGRPSWSRDFPGQGEGIGCA